MFGKRGLHAPILHIVAIPVQEKLSTPGPWYSTIAPVPPLTVRISATLRIMSGVHVSAFLLLWWGFKVAGKVAGPERTTWEKDGKEIRKEVGKQFGKEVTV